MIKILLNLLIFIVLSSSLSPNLKTSKEIKILNKVQPKVEDKTLKKLVDTSFIEKTSSKVKSEVASSMYFTNNNQLIINTSYLQENEKSLIKL